MAMSSKRGLPTAKGKGIVSLSVVAMRQMQQRGVASRILPFVGCVYSSSKREYHHLLNFFRINAFADSDLPHGLMRYKFRIPDDLWMIYDFWILDNRIF